jgi:hypothetical protein
MRLHRTSIQTYTLKLVNIEVVALYGSYWHDMAFILRPLSGDG